MKIKIAQFVPLVLALLSLGLVRFGQWCTTEGQACFRTELDRMFPYVITPLYFFALYSLPLVVVLAIVPRRAFISWLKLAAWALPLAFIFVASQPVVASFLSTDRDDSARLAAQIFTVLSLSLVAWKYYASRRADSVKA